MLYEPGHIPAVLTSSKVREKSLPHSSVAVAVANSGIAGQLMVVGAGNAAMSGAELSCTLIVWDAVEVFPQASVAVQLRVMLYEPEHIPAVLTSSKVRVNALLHSSVAVAVANSGTAGQLMVVGAGRAAITGAVIS